MGLVEVFLVCTVTEQMAATSIVGVAFTLHDFSKISWFAEPLPLLEAVQVAGPAAETESGERISVMRISSVARLAAS